MNKIYVICIFLFILGSCSRSTESENAGETNSEEPDRITRTDFGNTPEGQPVAEYTLRNANGIQMSVITYGGIIRTLQVPDRNGNIDDIVLGYDSLQQYVENSPYFGAIIGRYGNRIASGKFDLDDSVYTLAINNGPNHLHGGNRGFDKVIWKAEPFEKSDAVGVQLTYQSEDMEEGYPGNLDVTVTYTLDNDDQLIFDYKATTDKPTIINLTNHSYYNLTGMKEDVLGHMLEINADEYLAVDSTLIPEVPVSVTGTAFDFTSPTEIGARINDDDIQLENGKGYDHCWILNDTDEPVGFAASVYEPSSGRVMEIYTTEPGIQFYSGNFLDGSITGKEGNTYGFRSGLCLETEHFPDSPNRPDFPSVRLNPGDVYTSRTITKFSTK